MSAPVVIAFCSVGLAFLLGIMIPLVAKRITVTRMAFGGGMLSFGTEAFLLRNGSADIRS